MCVDASANPSENIGTMYEAVEDVSITDQQNEEAVVAELLTEGSSGDPEDLNIDTSDVHSEKF